MTATKIWLHVSGAREARHSPDAPDYPPTKRSIAIKNAFADENPKKHQTETIALAMSSLVHSNQYTSKGGRLCLSLARSRLFALSAGG